MGYYILARGGASKYIRLLMRNMKIKKTLSKRFCNDSLVTSFRYFSPLYSLNFYILPSWVKIRKSTLARSERILRQSNVFQGRVTFKRKPFLTH